MRKAFKNLFIIFVISLFIIAQTGCVNTDNKKSTETEQTEREAAADFSSEFADKNGCAVFYEPNENTYTYYNKDMCEERHSPFSTFKIVASLSALENNIVTSTEDKMNYSGAIYPFESWNKDLTLKEAFQNSCVWYYRQLIDKTGEENIQNTVDELCYGNQDVSQWEGSGLNAEKELNGFWLGSSLEISPIEQIKSLSYIFGENNSFSEKSISILKDIMLTELGDNSMKIYGKTGTGDNEGWFVGFAEQDEVKCYFAFYTENGSGPDLKLIAENVIKNHFAVK